jgi:predicted DNA-binding protein YlxM (UPF0122 family)
MGLLKDMNLDAVARTVSFDRASVIRGIHKSIKDLAGFEKKLRSLVSHYERARKKNERARKKTPCQS